MAYLSGMEKYEWTLIQEFYDKGNAFRDITREFGVPNQTINNAVRAGLFRSRPKSEAVKLGKAKRPNPNAYRNVKIWRRNLRIKIFHGFDGRCGICGLVDHPCVYDIHHLDQATKEFTISHRIRSWENIVNELQKCVMLCAPCHRKYHQGVTHIPENIQRFDPYKCSSIDLQGYYSVMETGAPILS